jgi:RND family efflux transporter MFP subunit
VAAAAAVPVRVAIAAPAANAGDIQVSGTVTYKREIVLSFKTGGVVKAYAVDVGDRVRAGQPLVNADPTDTAGRRAEADAAYEQAKANLERVEQLAASGFASQARLDEARAAFKRAEAARNSARYDESRAALTAPAEGVVLVRHAEAGQQLPPGAPVITIADLSAGMIMTAQVSDRQIVRIRTGDRAQLRLAGSGRVAAQGTVTRVGAKADRATGAFDVEISLDAPPEGLRSGLVGQAIVAPSATDESAGLLAVPAVALLEGRGDLAYVYVVGPGEKAVRVAVTVARFLEDLVLVKGGLRRGDRVVTAGAAYLRNGQLVTVSAGSAP